MEILTPLSELPHQRNGSTLPQLLTFFFLSSECPVEKNAGVLRQLLTCILRGVAMLACTQPLISKLEI